MQAKVSEVKKHDSEQFAKKLRSLIAEKNINLKQIADDLELPVMTIRRLIYGETTNPKLSTITLLANYFNVSIGSLIDSKDNSILNKNKKSDLYFIPLLDWQTAATVSDISELDLDDWENWQPISTNKQMVISEKAFALESRPSMAPRFPLGTVFIIEPTLSPKDGDLLLIKIKDTKELTLREVTIDPPEWRLASLVEGSTDIVYSEKKHSVIGINILTIVYNSRAS